MCSYSVTSPLLCIQAHTEPRRSSRPSRRGEKVCVRDHATPPMRARGLLIRDLNRERPRSHEMRPLRRHVRGHHGPSRPSVEGGEPDGDGASRRTGPLRVSHDTRTLVQRMCQNSSLSRTSRKVRHRSVSGMAAGFRRRGADDRVTNDRQVSACRRDSGRARPSCCSGRRLDVGHLGRSREASAPACKRLPKTWHARWLRSGGHDKPGTPERLTHPGQTVHKGRLGLVRPGGPRHRDVTRIAQAQSQHGHVGEAHHARWW
jgi:hypothetical protein